MLKVEEETEEENEEEREKFLTVLKQFHLDRGTPMTRPPVLSQKTLDLYRLYQLVQEYGGMEKVCSKHNAVISCVYVQFIIMVHFYNVHLQSMRYNSQTSESIISFDLYKTDVSA